MSAAISHSAVLLGGRRFPPWAAPRHTSLRYIVRVSEAPGILCLGSLPTGNDRLYFNTFAVLGGY